MIIYYILDTETTGLKAGYNEMIQVSVLRLSDGAQVTQNVKAQFPQRAAKEALEIQGKTIFDLKDGEEMITAVNYVDEFLLEDKAESKNRCIVGHNVSFDKRFLHASWDSVNKKFPADLWLDTKEFARKYSKKIGIPKPKLSLAACLEMTGIKPRLGAHNAVIDTLNTGDLFNMLMGQNLNHLSCIKNEPHLPRAHA